MERGVWLQLNFVPVWLRGMISHRGKNDPFYRPSGDNRPSPPPPFPLGLGMMTMCVCVSDSLFYMTFEIRCQPLSTPLSPSDQMRGVLYLLSQASQAGRQSKTKSHWYTLALLQDNLSNPSVLMCLPCPRSLFQRSLKRLKSNIFTYYSGVSHSDFWWIC